MESTHLIRELSRNLLKFNRQIQRDQNNDDCRNLDKNRVTSEMVAEIGNKLKVKSSITASDLHILKNAIIEDSKNIEVVLRNQGSLRGLVREISGIDARRQVAAAGCVCNLSLGDSKACVSIAKAAGPYLVAALANPSTEMAVTCAWTLGNMAGSGTKASELLIAQGALSKLTDMLSSTNDDISEAALYAVVHFAYQMKDSLSKEYLEKILQAFSNLEVSMNSSQLLFILSCHEDFRLESNLLKQLLDSTLNDLCFVLTLHFLSTVALTFGAYVCLMTGIVIVIFNMKTMELKNYFNFHNKSIFKCDYNN